MTLRHLVPAFVGLALAGCTSAGPDYTAPKIHLPARYAEGGADPAGAVARQEWWRGYRDPKLDALVARGLAQNLDMAVALARVAQAQAALRQTGNAAAVSGALTASTTETGTEGSGSTRQNAVSAGPSVLLDLFGSERRSREAALARLEGAELDRGTAQLAFLSSLVTNYIDARYYQTALAITRRNIASREQTLKLVQDQRRIGTATELDVLQAQALLDTTRASLPGLESNFLASVYSIATLLAEPAQPLIRDLQPGAPQPRAAGDAAAGVPADLLRNRPDVRSAERSYAAAVAKVGVADAALYPSLTLAGTVSVSGGSTSWSFGPRASLPVFSRPRLLAAREQQISSAREAELNWRSSVLTAVENVQAAQTALIRDQRTVRATSAAVESYQRVVELAGQNYKIGTTTLLDLLDSQRALASEELALAGAIRDRALGWSSVQIAAGKGWQVAVPLDASR